MRRILLFAVVGGAGFLGYSRFVFGAAAPSK